MKQDLLNNKCCEQRLLFANTRIMAETVSNDRQPEINRPVLTRQVQMKKHKIEQRGEQNEN